MARRESTPGIGLPEIYSAFPLAQGSAGPHLQEMAGWQTVL